MSVGAAFLNGTPRSAPPRNFEELAAQLFPGGRGRLRRYADRAQFIVVTHQKRTMEAADTLYGVTMGDDGVSKVISHKLPRAA